jgi:hypothetical protein
MSDGAFHVLSTIVAWLALGVLVIALLADWVIQRFRRRRRCPRCWYSMQGSPGLTCSECGHEAKRERKLFKARKRWRLVWVALPATLEHHLATVMSRFADEIVTMRPAWPRDVPLHLRINDSEYHRFEGSTIEVIPHLDGMRRARQSFFSTMALVHPSFEWFDLTHEVAAAPLVDSQLTFDLTLALSPWNPSVRHECWRATISKEVTLVEDVAKILDPYHDESIGRHLERSIDIHLSSNRSGSLLFRIEDVPYGVPDDVAIAVSIQIVYDEEIVLHGDIWDAGRWPGKLDQFLPLRGDTSRLRDATMDDSSWRLIVRGDPIIALRDFDAARYWSGMVEMPLREVMRRGK